MIRTILVIVVALLALLGGTAYLGLKEDNQGAAPASAVAAVDPAEQVRRGGYLSRAGNCMACHTTRGGTPYAGGRGILTPFGTIYSSNLTPDAATGIGSWTADDFWRAIHNGKSKDGRLLYPAFPYTNYTRVAREDADALFAYFRSLPPASLTPREPELRFPYNHRILLVGWRALFFRPGIYAPETGQSVEWNRGAYLVQGLGHCSACHTARNVFGATRSGEDLGGALLPITNWYAPALTAKSEAGLGDWELGHIRDLLKTGVSARGVTSGPMAEVVQHSLQHLSDNDVQAMSVYLKALPQTAGAPKTDPEAASRPENQNMLKLGATVYENHCAACHKAGGQGEAPHFPALAGSRAVVLNPPVNTIRAVLHGGYPPSTGGNPRPYGMPPFGAMLNDQEVAAVLSYIRTAWGNQGTMILPSQVSQYRTVPLE